MSAAETAARDLAGDAFRRVCSHCPSGVAIVGGLEADGAPFGFTVSSFRPESFQPALISISVGASAAGLGRLSRSSIFSVSILGEDQAQIAQVFGRPGSDGFREVSPVISESGLPMVSGAAAHLVCEITKVMEIGDHAMILAAARRGIVRGGRPLVYWRRTFFGLHLDYPFLGGDAALDQFVQQWEDGTLPKSAWTHGAHVAVTAYYAFDCRSDELFPLMKRGITNFNTCVGTVNGPDSGYHETLTRFWSEMIAAFVSERRDVSRLETVRAAVMRFGQDRDLHQLYFSFDVVRSRRARQEWVPPDLEPPTEWL